MGIQHFIHNYQALLNVDTLNETKIEIWLIYRTVQGIVMFKPSVIRNHLPTTVVVPLKSAEGIP